MKIQVIQIGKSKDRYLEDGVNEMRKRLTPFCQLEMSILQPKGSVEVESLMIQKVIPKEAFVVVLDEKGKELSSMDFSKFIGERKDNGDRIAFIIGGPHGLSENLKKSADLLMSMSKMTFTHQMVRLFLLEQVYRGFCILQGKTYHY